ncbi:hypothetical protein D3C74_497410 [compost metagenome]
MAEVKSTASAAAEVSVVEAGALVAVLLLSVASFPGLLPALLSLLEHPANRMEAASSPAGTA